MLNLKALPSTPIHYHAGSDLFCHTNPWSQQTYPVTPKTTCFNFRRQHVTGGWVLDLRVCILRHNIHLILSSYFTSLGLRFPICSQPLHWLRGKAPFLETEKPCVHFVFLVNCLSPYHFGWVTRCLFKVILNLDRFFPRSSRASAESARAPGVLSGNAACRLQFPERWQTQ